MALRKMIACGLGLAILFGTNACSKNDEPENNGTEQGGNGGGNSDPDWSGPLTDLGAKGLANCYIVQQPGAYEFEATNMFNLGDGLPVPPEIQPDGAMLVWQSVKGSISRVELLKTDNADIIRFEVKEADGNALIAATEGDRIVWSWHIWMPKEEISSVRTATGYDVMNLNLGAMTNTPGDPSSYGMLYQWGRKDPFPAAATLTGTTLTVGAPLYDMDGNSVKIANSSWTDNNSNNLAYAIAHPTTVLSNYFTFATSHDWLTQGDDSLWGNPDGTEKWNDVYLNKGRKTCYDPSPAGWRVGPVDVFRNATTSGQFAYTLDEFNVADTNNDGLVTLDDYNYGWHVLIDTATPLYFPAAARYDGSYAMLMGSVSGIWGSYWSNSPSHSASFAGAAVSSLSFSVADPNGASSITMTPNGSASKADAYSVRCIRN